MIKLRGSMSDGRRMLAMLACCAGALAAGQVAAGGLILYEVGTADVGLASAGFGARAQDASTVFSNPAGMTRLAGTQFLAAGQALWSNAQFSAGAATSPGLGRDDGGYALGSDGWFVGGGGFLSYSVSPELKLGFALTGNVGMPLNYDNDWVGRYYVQSTTLLGVSFLPSIAYKVNEKLCWARALTRCTGRYQSGGDQQLRAAVRRRAAQARGQYLGLGSQPRHALRNRSGYSPGADLEFAGRSRFQGLGEVLESCAWAGDGSRQSWRAEFGYQGRHHGAAAGHGQYLYAGE
ncbi:MAG: outer membrane protein transport protein [Candidatus Accumulibacter sp.]|nr:outer membrane protein transport protein [Accumulibacter sp.]